MNIGYEQFEKMPEAQVFRHLRIAGDMTMRDLAERLGINHSLIAHYEKGRQPIPRPRIREMCKVFKITVSELNEYADGLLEIPINYKDECLNYLSKMNIDQMRAIYAVLKHMNIKLKCKLGLQPAS